MASSSKKLSTQMALEAELKLKSKLLEQSISQFTEATCEIGELERLLAYSRIDPGGDAHNPYASSRKARQSAPARSPFETPLRNEASYSTSSRGPYVYRVANEVRPEELEWAVEESQLAQMRDEVGIYVKEENKTSIAHLQARDDLQESWDKLVKLRTHISFFHAAIEEAKIEEIAMGAQGWSTGTSNIGDNPPMYPLNVGTSSLDGAVPPATADDFAQLSQTPMKDSVQNVDRFVGIYVLREKVQRRDYMRKAVADSERELKLARDKVSNFSDELIAISSSSGASLGGSFSSTRGMTLRQRVLESNLELEKAEVTYLRNKDDLAEFEAELGTALLGVSEAVVTELKGMNRPDGANDGADLNLSHFLEQADQMDDAVSVASSISKTQSVSRSMVVTATGQRIHKPEAHTVHTFSLQEVLSGQIRISRMNGEAAGSYRERLQRRVQAIEPLVTQLKLEVETKAEAARQARMQLKDAEVRRLRAELQLSNCEGIIRDKKEAKQQLILSQQANEASLNLQTPASHGGFGGLSALDRTRTEEKVYTRFHNQLAYVDDLQYDIDIHTTSKKRSKTVSIKQMSREEEAARERGWNRSRSPSATRDDPMHVNDIAGRGGYSDADEPALSPISKGSPSGHAKRPEEGKKRSPRSRRGLYTSEHFTRSSEYDDDEDVNDGENRYNRSSDNIVSEGENGEERVSQSEGTGVSRRRHNTSGGKMSHKLSSTRLKQGSLSAQRSASANRHRVAVASRSPPPAPRREAVGEKWTPNRPLTQLSKGKSLHEPSTKWPGSSRPDEKISLRTPASSDVASDSEEPNRGRQRLRPVEKKKVSRKKPVDESAEKKRQPSREASSHSNERGANVGSRKSQSTDAAVDVLKKSKTIDKDNVSEVIKAAELISNQVSDALQTGTGLDSQRRFRSSRRLRAGQSGDEEEDSRASRAPRTRSRSCGRVHSDGYSSIDDDTDTHAATKSRDVRFSSPGALSVSTIGNASASHTVYSYPVHNYADSPNHKYTASAVKRRTSADESMARIMEMLNKNQQSLDMLNHTQDLLKTMIASPPHARGSSTENRAVPKEIFVLSSPDETPVAKGHPVQLPVAASEKKSPIKKRHAILAKTPTNKSKPGAELGSPFLKKGVTTPIVRGRAASQHPSRVQLARKVASLHERKQSRSRSRARGSPTRSRSASPLKESPTGRGESITLAELEKELAQGIKAEPFEFDERPKPFHRIQERFDNDALNRSSESKCSIESSPRSAAGSSPRAGSCGGHSIIAQSVQVKSVDQDVVETSVPYNNAPAKFDDDNSDDDAADHLELYVQKQQLLKQILSSSEGNPGKEHAETVSIGVDTSGLNVREAGWLWSPNSRAKDRESREQEMNERIEYYRRNRCALSPSRSPSPSRIANSSGEHVSLRENPTKKARVPPSKQAAEKRKAAAAAANLASVNSTAANVKAHILVEQKKLEKCIIKLTNLKDMRDKHKTRLRELKVKKRMERQQMQGSNESVFERSSVSMKLTVLSARNLPEMKRQKHSADPFVELWVKSAAHVGEEDPSMQIVDGMSMQRHTTTIKWAMLFPLWEESFDFTIPCDMGADGTVAISDDCLRIVLRDAVKSDIAINEAANIQSIIGECFLNFDTLLDQKVHTFWLPVVDTVVATPELHHLYRSRHKIPGDCALKVETRLLYSKEILLRNKISESDKQISNLSTFVDACSNELLELAYGWEQMQQKQQKLNSLTMQPAKLQPKRKQSPVRERSEVPDNVLRPKSFEDFMGSQHAHSSSPTVALISGQAKGTSPQVRLEHRGAEDMLLLARSNSSIEIDAGDVILPVSKRGLTPADKVNIACGPVTSRDQSAFTANPAVPFSGETTTSISFDDLSSGKNRSPTTHAADKEASLAAEQSGRDSRSPSHPPNMSIFRGAGGGRNPPKQPVREKMKPERGGKKRWM